MLFVAAGFVIVNFIVDMLYAVLDPQDPPWLPELRLRLVAADAAAELRRRWPFGCCSGAVGWIAR